MSCSNLLHYVINDTDILEHTRKPQAHALDFLCKLELKNNDSELFFPRSKFCLPVETGSILLGYNNATLTSYLCDKMNT